MPTGGRKRAETQTATRASTRRPAMEDTALLVLPDLEAAALEAEVLSVEALVTRAPVARSTIVSPAGAQQPTIAALPTAVDVSFEAFFEAEYSRLLRAMSLVTGNRHEAEEVVQDAFVRALERWDRVRAADNRPGYLYRMALNLYRSKLRRMSRAARKIVAPMPEPDPFTAADARDSIGRALAALPAGQREAVVMVEWMGMSADEVGEVLGISPVTVRVRIHRARATLRPLLEPGEDE